MEMSKWEFFLLCNIGGGIGRENQVMVVFGKVLKWIHSLKRSRGSCLQVDLAALLIPDTWLHDMHAQFRMTINSI